MLQYLAALVLVAHGIGHLTGILASWSGIDVGFTKEPWIFGGNVMIDSTTGKAFMVVWLIALALFIGSGIGVFMGEQWWRTLAIIGAVAILLVLLLPWRKKVTDFFELP
ncbi:MAG: hypothetical protein A3K60_08730 [Euryarchaeota archaeon RBG_19FT_COMBO_56_21]|nr:MAG: hypothetical protein A3K60_08730 [Euryarchaeota archaeon RBG_19FT_COMBO_56_21]